MNSQLDRCLIWQQQVNILVHVWGTLPHVFVSIFLIWLSQFDLPQQQQVYILVHVWGTLSHVFVSIFLIWLSQFDQILIWQQQVHSILLMLLSQFDQCLTTTTNSLFFQHKRSNFDLTFHCLQSLKGKDDIHCNADWGALHCTEFD